MNTDAIRTVLKVQTLGSIAGAARALDVDPSSVSRTLAAFEAEIGLRLFQRSTRRLAPTVEGASLLASLAAIIEEMDAAIDRAGGKNSKPQGLLRLTASVAFADEVIVPLLPEFLQRYPDIQLELISSDANLDLIEANIELAVRLAPAPTGDLISTKLMASAYHVVASPHFLRGKAIETPHDLTKFNCIRFVLPGLPKSWWFKSGDDKPFDVQVGGNLSLSNAIAIRSAVRNGMGIGMLADWMVRSDISEGRLVTLFADHRCALSDFDTAAWALYPNRAYLPQRTRVMLDYLREKLTFTSK